VSDTAINTLVLLLSAGLALRCVVRLRQLREAEPAELSSVREGSPLPTAREAAHPWMRPPGIDSELALDAHLTGRSRPMSPHAKCLMVQMLLNEGYITQVQAVELLDGEPCAS